MGRNSKSNEPGGLVEFAEIMVEQTETYGPARKRNKFGAFVAFLALSVSLGLIGGFLTTPLTVTTAVGVREVSDFWDGLPTELPEAPLPQRSRILDVNGTEIAEFYSENRILVDLENVSPYVVDALLATEDSRFYEHNGVDVEGLGRALVRTAQGDMQGGSTITQQLVKNTLVVHAANAEDAQAAIEATPMRKIEEMKYAIALEEQLSKDEILERYLNIALFSNAVYGIGTAANYYFGKDVKDLTLGESATLIGLLKNPSGYDPLVKPEAAKERRDVVISRMLSVGAITAVEADEAKAQEIPLNVQKPQNGCQASPYPYYCQWVLNTLHVDPAFGDTEEERSALVYRGGLTIQTPLDPRIQTATQSSVDEALGRGNRVASAIAVVEPGTGRVTGMAQNRTWGREEESTDAEKRTEVIYPTRVAFQSASTFKVFTAAAALEAGYPLDGVIDAPTQYTNPNFNTPSGGIQNLASYHAGPMNLATATARSSNTFYATLQEKVGVLAVADMADNLGISVPREGPQAVGARDASFTLGTISVSPLQMSAAYATFASGGVYCDPVNIIKVTGPMGEDIPSPDGNCRQAISKQTADNMVYLLSQVIDGDDPDRSGKDMSLGRPAGGKTGTTNNTSAVWFAGFTPQYAAAVWVGDPRGGVKYPLDNGLRVYGRWVDTVFGGTVAGPIWKDAMAEIMAPLPVANFPTSSGPGASNLIPDVRGMGVQEAVSVLIARGYDVEISAEQAPVTEFSNPDQVMSQTPVPGTNNASSTTKITITLSSGSRTDWVIPKNG